jgi:hypothetical protein
MACPSLQGTRSERMDCEAELRQARRELRIHLQMEVAPGFDEWLQNHLQSILEDIERFKGFLDEDGMSYPEPPLHGGGYEPEFIRCSRCEKGHREPTRQCVDCEVDLPWETPPRDWMTEIEWAKYEIEQEKSNS